VRSLGCATYGLGVCACVCVYGVAEPFRVLLRQVRLLVTTHTHTQLSWDAGEWACVLGLGLYARDGHGHVD
jgi:hypothetical protein